MYFHDRIGGQDGYRADRELAVIHSPVRGRGQRRRGVARAGRAQNGDSIALPLIIQCPGNIHRRTYYLQGGGLTRKQVGAHWLLGDVNRLEGNAIRISASYLVWAQGIIPNRHFVNIASERVSSDAFVRINRIERCPNRKVPRSCVAVGPFIRRPCSRTPTAVKNPINVNSPIPYAIANTNHIMPRPVVDSFP